MINGVLSTFVTCSAHNIKYKLLISTKLRFENREPHRQRWPNIQSQAQACIQTHTQSPYQTEDGKKECQQEKQMKAKKLAANYHAKLPNIRNQNNDHKYKLEAIIIPSKFRVYEQFKWEDIFTQQQIDGKHWDSLFLPTNYGTQHIHDFTWNPASSTLLLLFVCSIIPFHSLRLFTGHMFCWVNFELFYSHSFIRNGTNSSDKCSLSNACTRIQTTNRHWKYQNRFVYKEEEREKIVFISTVRYNRALLLLLRFFVLFLAAPVFCLFVWSLHRKVWVSLFCWVSPFISQSSTRYLSIASAQLHHVVSCCTMC